MCDKFDVNRPILIVSFFAMALIILFSTGAWVWLKSKLCSKNVGTEPLQADSLIFPFFLIPLINTWIYSDQGTARDHKV
jgi:hypothetical protein